jgi:hypothetical protein
MNAKSIRLIFLVPALSVVVTSVARAEIVGWWKCDEGSGTVARDASRYGNDVFFQGDPQWVAGHFNGAIEFDGSGDYLDRGVYASSLDIVGAVTVTAWVKPGAVARDHEICGNVTTGPNGGGYMLGIYSNDRVELKIWSSAGSSLPGNHPAGGIGLQAGTWYFLAGTYSETAGGPIIRTYVNGVLDQELISPVEMAPSPGTFKIGRDPAAPGLGEFAGVIDDVRVYNQVLTENALQDVMLGKRPPSKVAVAPVPQDEQTDVPRDVVLGWTPGDYARTHDVYLGTVFADVNNASRSNPLGTLASQSQDANTYAPPVVLDYGQTYVWRVDEVNAPPDAAIQRGDVWRFTTETMVYAIPCDKITVTASSSQDGGPEKTIDGSGLVQDLHSVDTKAMWLSGEGDPGSAWIRYDFDRAYKLERMSVWNYNGPLLLAGFGIKDATIEYSPDGVAWTALPGTNAFAKATGKDGYASNTTVELDGAMAKSIRITAASNWGGSFFRQYGLSEVRFLFTPVQARYPSPDSGTTGVAVDVTLSWRAGRGAVQHDLYLSTDEQSVQDGTAPVTTLSQTGEGPLSLDLGKMYYWKVSEVNAVETPAIVEGNVWSFSTVEYLVVDDFERYNDQENTGTRIYETWIDGWTDPQKGGSQVGYTDPTFVEQTIVHGGRQSMPLSYDNAGAAGYSEAELPLAAEDWTRAGITALVLYFHGVPANSGGQLYVKINGVKVLFQGSTDALKRPSWTQWNIDLATVGGNLQSVRTLSIGIDGAGATGILYVDDIRLYASAPAPAGEEIWIEAEAADTITAPLQVFSTIPGASGGQYIEVQTGNSSVDAPPTQGIATYKFTVQGGTYRIRGRVMTSGDADSFWLRLQGATTQTKNHASGWVRWNGLQDGDWHWEDVFSSDDGNQIVLFTMKPGTYTLEVAYREETSLLDALMIVRVN